MYVTLDVEALEIKHLHESHGVLSSLAKIELAHCRVYIFAVALENFAGLTDEQLRILHSHVMCEPIKAKPLAELSRELVETVSTFPPSDVVEYEVTQQARKIALTDTGFYRYRKGSSFAATLEELYTPPSINVRTPLHVLTPLAPVKTTPQAAQTPGALPTWHPQYKAG
jgi:hypothetical protein